MRFHDLPEHSRRFQNIPSYFMDFQSLSYLIGVILSNQIWFYLILSYLWWAVFAQNNTEVIPMSDNARYQNRSHWPWQLNQRGHKTHMWNALSLTPSPEERNRRGNQADRLRIFSVSMMNVEVAISVKHRRKSRRFWSSRQVIPHVPRSGSRLPPCSDARWGCH